MQRSRSLLPGALRGSNDVTDIQTRRLLEVEPNESHYQGLASGNGPQGERGDSAPFERPSSREAWMLKPSEPSHPIASADLHTHGEKQRASDQGPRISTEFDPHFPAHPHRNTWSSAKTHSTARTGVRRSMSAGDPTIHFLPVTGVQKSAASGLTALVKERQRLQQQFREQESRALKERIMRRFGRVSMIVGAPSSASGGQPESPSFWQSAREAWRRLTGRGEAPRHSALGRQFSSRRRRRPRASNGSDSTEGSRAMGSLRKAESMIFSVDPDHHMAEVLNSLDLGTFGGRMRFLCIKLISAPDFELVVILLIFANCVSLAMYRPKLDSGSEWNQALEHFELALNACFTLELFARVIAVGGVLAFLSYPWNLFDAAMVSVGYTQFLPTSGEGAEGFRALRAMRALRPLRTITRFDSLRSVVVSFMEAIPLLASVSTMLLFFLFTFAIAGVQLFGDVYHQACVDTATGHVEEDDSMEDSVGCGSRSCPTDTEYNFTCETLPEGTQVNVAGYDNVGRSMLTIFQCVTLSNWNYVMYRTMDVYGEATVLFYVILILLGAYYLMILFLAVLKTKFGEAQDLFAEQAVSPGQKGANSVVKAYNGMKTGFGLVATSIHTRFTRAWNAEDDSNQGDVSRFRSKMRAARGRVCGWWARLRRQIRRLVNHKLFDRFFFFCIFFNTVLLAIEYDGMSLDMLQTLTTMNLVLTQIFTLEVILKMASLGVVKYFKDNFNTFDLVVVILSQVEIIIASTQDNNLSALQSLKTLRVLKAFRVFRIFKMFRYLESLRKIGEVLFKSMSSFVSIGLLTLLFNIVFAIMGLHVFGQYEPDIVYPNFRTFVDSCVLVFQVLTLEDWEVLAYSYARDAGYGAVAFFVAWVIVGNYVFLTLFLAVTLEAFESKYDTETAAQVASVVQEKLGLQQASEEGRNAAGGRGSTMSQEGAKVLVIASAKDSAADDGQQASPSTGREMAAGSEPSGKGSSPQADQSMLSPRDWTSNSSPRNASTPTAYGKLDLGRATKDRESIPVVPMHGEGSMSLEKPAENSIEYFLNAPEPSPESGPRADLGSREFHRPNADLQRLVSSRATAVSDIDEAQDAVQRLGSRSSLVRDEDTIETAPLMPADPLRPSAPATGRRPPRAAGPVAESDDNAAMGAPGPSPNERHGGSSSGAAIQVQGSFNPRLRMSSMARGGTGSGGHAASRSGRDLQQQKNAPLPGAERSDPQGDQGASGSAESGKVSVTGSFNPRLRMGSKQLRDGASAPATAAPLGAELPRTPGTPLGQAQAPPSLLATQQGASSSSTSTQLKRIGSRSTNESTSTGLGSFNPRLRMGGKEARGPIPTAGSRRGSLTSLPEEHDVLNSELPEEMNQAAQPFAADDSSHDSNSRRLKRNASRATNDSGTGSLSSFNPRRRFGQAEQPGGLPEVASQSSQSLRPAPSLQRTASRVTQESVASSAGSCNPRLRYGSGAAASGDGFHSRMSDAAEMEGRAAEHPQRPLMSGYSGDRSDFPGQAHDARPAANKFMGRLSSINLRRMSSIIMGQPHIPPVSAAGPAPAPAGSELGPPPINSKGRRGTMGALIQRIKGWSVGEESDSEETDDDDSNDGDGSSASDRQQAAGQGRLSKRRTTSVSSKVSQSRIEQEILQARELMGEEIPDEAASQMGIRKQRKEDYPPLVGKSLGLLDADNPFRSALYSICTNKYFDYTMFFFIIASCAAMVYEHPFIEDNSTEYWALHYVEIALTSIFGLEAVAKIVAFGMLPYARSVTNLLDLLIVVTSVLLLALETVASNLQAIKGLRVLRAAKPLRTLTRSKGMMLVFKSLSMSLMSMANVSVICLLFFIIFAILGVQLFSGEFYYCSQPRDIDGVVIRHKDNCTGLGEDGNPLEWSNNFLNFDNLGNALMTLFITSTLDGYVETMTLAMSTRGKDHQPMLGANAGSFLFFCIFIMVCAFCLLNLYVGVVFFQFTRIRMLSEAGSAFLTSSQREWLEMSRMVLKTSPLDKVAAPKGRFRRWCYDICMTAAFEYFMIAVIVINVAFMASEQYNMSDAHEDVSDISNLVFTSMFILEAAFKLTGTGWASYWRNSWNRFDLFVVATSVLDLIVTYFGNSFGSFLQVLRVQKLFRLMRVSRVLKLMKNLKGVRSLFSTLVSSLPAFWSVGSLLVLLFFIYAYVGVLLFGTVRINEGMNHHANFTKFWKALNVLLRVATNDDWYPIMKDCMASPPDCDPELGDCGSPVAQWYFSSFVCFVSIIVLNLFTSVVIENFEKQMDQDSWKIMPTMLEEFRELWSHYDDGTSTITPRDLHHLLTRLSPPLGLSRSTTNAELLRFVASLDIPLENGRVPFHRTLFELVRRVSETEIPEGQMKDGIENMVKNAFGNQMHDDMMTFNMAMIVMRLQRKWRANVRSNKIKASRARRRARMDGLVSFEELLKRKDEYADEIMDARMDGQPWVFDDSAGMGSIASWALISAGKAAPQVGKSLRNTTRRGTYFFNGLGQRMQAAFGSNASPSTRTTMNSSKQSPASGGLAGRLRRRLGTVALQAGGSQGISSTRSTRTTKLSGGQSKRGLWRGRNSVVPAQAANLAELAQQNIAARERSLTSASENAKKIQAGSGQDARARYNMGHINVGTAISDWQQYANAAMLQEMMEDGISDSDSEPAGSDGEATAYSSDAPAYSTDHEIEGHSRSSMPELAAPAEAPIEEKAFEPAQKEKAGKNSGKDLVNETALQSLLDDISDSGSSAGGRGG